MSEINARFRSTRPTFNKLMTSGVVLHHFDETEDFESQRMWLPCAETSASCNIVRDRISTSMVYSGLPRTLPGLRDWPAGSMRLFAKSKGGIIVAPSVVKQSLLCGYAMDAGSRERQCEPVGVSASCVPGCIATEHPSWCDPSASDQWCGGAAWRPQDLSSMLAQQKSYNYNELVLDAAAWVEAMPRTVTAFFAPKTTACVTAQRNCLDEARRARNAFTAHYNLEESAVPLVWLHIDDDYMENPFELVGS